jgi:hypothetical protein
MLPSEKIEIVIRGRLSPALRKAMKEFEAFVSGLYQRDGIQPYRCDATFALGQAGNGPPGDSVPCRHGPRHRESSCTDGLTHLVGAVHDQERIHDLFQLLLDLNIELVSVNPVADPDIS